MKDPIFTAMLDTILPGDGAEFPAAGKHGLAAQVTAMAADIPADANALNTLYAALPGDFAKRSHRARTATLQRIERDDPQDFARVVAAVCTAYCDDPAIRKRVARLTGPPAGQAPDLSQDQLRNIVRKRGRVWGIAETA